MTKQLQNKAQGFTLLELLVSVTIIGIIAAFAVPSFNSSLERGRLRLVAETLRADLRDAKRMTLAKGASGSSTIAFTDGTSWAYSISGNKSLSRSSSDFASGIAVTSSFSGDAFTVTYLQQALLATSIVVNLNISNSEGSITVGQDSAGRIYMCSNSGMGYPSC